MNYYWFNREKLLKNAWNKYHNKGGEKKLQSIIENADLIKFEARNKYKNLPEKEKNKKENIKKKDIT